MKHTSRSTPDVDRQIEPARGSSAAPDIDETTCPRCGESQQLAKVKGCIKCLHCGFKFDCNGW
jgi:ribosomal protein L37AE/L43A